MERKEVENWFKSLQDDICVAIEKEDESGKFEEDLWERPEGGGGRTRIIQNGVVIEKGGVNFSAVHGPTPEKILNALGLEKSDFYATGVSIVMHPASPMVPIIHMNVRYFEMSNGVSWFGGGIDLTPHYVVDEDATWFHKQMKNCCDRHDSAYYDKFKKWADDYFYIKHRKETRGIGGIFFDRLMETKDISIDERWEFVKDVGSQFAPIYTKLMNQNKSLSFSENEKSWQYLRRGRYVEFNLVLDKGTKFGLDTDGRTESILMSLPPQANWEYMHEVAPGSKEEMTNSKLKKGIDWVK
ncbi:MAG: oxygen-dependent coproporphyrinogen oxidase [Reichenbachiella sp.]